MLLDRRQFLKRALLLSGVAAAAGAAGYSIHSNIMEVTQHLLTGILPKGQMLKIAVVSDFHAPRSFVNPNELAALVNEAECDALFIVGDTIDDSANLKLVPRLFENIKVSGSKFAVLGNWEHWSSVDLASLSDAYDAANVQLLVNEGSTLELESNQTTILGLDDLVGGEPDFELVESAEGFRIVLTHCPASFDHLRQLPEETLVLSGHTHGGQISPLGFPLYLPKGSGRYVCGWYQRGNSFLFVSRGLGNSVVPIRIGSRPELSFIHLS